MNSFKQLTRLLSIASLSLFVSFNANATPQLNTMVTAAIANNDITTMTGLLNEIRPKTDYVCANEMPFCEEYTDYVNRLEAALNPGVK